MKTSGNKTYTIKFLKNVIEKEIPALPAKIKLMVQEAIKKRLTVDSFNLGKPLCHSFRGQYRIRVSNYRIIYIINHSERKVLITAVGYRKNIYKHRRLHNYSLSYNSPNAIRYVFMAIAGQ